VIDFDVEVIFFYSNLWFKQKTIIKKLIKDYAFVIKYWKNIMNGNGYLSKGISKTNLEDS
jgi:hypothetical protein